MNFKKFIKNSKAISPIFATLILIAIAVIAGVVVYMFTSGTLATMTNGGTAGQEKVTVQGASGASGLASVTAYVEQTSGPQASVNGLIVKDGSGNTIASLTVTSGPVKLTQGVLQNIVGTMPGTDKLGANTAYTVIVTTSAGGSFISPAFTTPAS